MKNAPTTYTITSVLEDGTTEVVATGVDFDSHSGVRASSLRASAYNYVAALVRDPREDETFLATEEPTI